eukprot:TRINITY_DN19643_c0_g1_i1.p1 TRINITY_DN19643_c0_g1~~TRINITY_DN19643_c0_g1_i1.p1  ORF type:complete len:193 (+),score=19.68 TRINITY_DN19643_c0_g1_i1:114-692(+)
MDSQFCTTCRGRSVLSPLCVRPNLRAVSSRLVHFSAMSPRTTKYAKLQGPLVLRHTRVQSIRNTLPSGPREETDGSEERSGGPEGALKVETPEENGEPMVLPDSTDDIRQRLKELRRAREKSGSVEEFWSGVVEETSQIEWPSFQKVLGTTGLVLLVIIGSSTVLLTVNAILAELSDKIFNGVGVQDIIWGK